MTIALNDDDDFCDCGESECLAANLVLAAALAKLEKDEHVQLFYRSQGDCLSNEQVDEIFAGKLTAVEEYILEWASDNDHYSIEYEVEQLVDPDEKEMLETHELLPQLEDAIREKDESDPFGELAGATDDVWARIWICDASECYDDPDVLDWEIETICKAGGIRRDLNEAAIRTLLLSDQAYGEDCLMFRATMSDLISRVFGPDEWGGMPDDPKIRIRDPKLWIDRSVVDLQGWTSAELRISINPQREHDYWTDGYLTPDEFSVIARFNEYKRELEEFYQYRAKLMERVK